MTENDIILRKTKQKNIVTATKRQKRERERRRRRRPKETQDKCNQEIPTIHNPFCKTLSKESFARELA